MPLQSSIRLGLMPPLTGVVEIYGQEIINAAQIACDEINAAGGVLGQKLELVIEDDGSVPESAVLAAEKLINQHGCVALIGNLLSNSRISVVHRVSELYKIPLLNFSFYEGSICSPYFFHFAALPNQQIDKMIPYMRKKYGPRFYFAGNNYEWPRGSIDAAKKALLNCGGEVIEEEYFPIGVSKNEIELLIEKLSRSNADVFVPYFAGTDQLNLLNIFSEKGLKNKIAVVMGHYDEAMTNKLSNSVREGFYSSNTYFMTVPTEKNRMFLKTLSNKKGVSGIWPNGNGVITNFGESAYICVKAFATAANQAKSLAEDKLIKALETVRISGLQGEVIMDPVTHHAQVNTFLAKSQADGSFKIVENFGAIAPIIPDRYKHLQINSGKATDTDRFIHTRIVEQMEEAVLLVCVESHSIVYSNPGAEKLFGFIEKEFIGLKLTSLVSNTENSSVPETKSVEDSLYKKGFWKGEVKCTPKNSNKTIWCSVSISAFTHATYGEVWMAVFKDISDLKSEKKQLENLIHGLNQSTIVSITDEKGKIIFVNDKFCEVTGFSRIELIGNDHRLLKSSFHSSEYFAKLWKTILSGKVWHDEMCNRKKDGTLIWTDTSISSICDENGEIRFMSICFDITQRKLAEEKLKEASKMAVLGEMAAGIAHEINNPLAVTIAKAERLLKSIKENSLNPFELAKGLNKILDTSHRIAKIVKGLRTFSRNGSKDPFEPENIKSIIFDTIEICSDRLKDREITLFASEISDITLNCRAFQISQVILNLLNNSIDAIQNLETKWIRIELNLNHSDKIQLIITDSGTGIPNDIAEKILQPFYTTKPVGKGTGLGLSISHGIALEHNGKLYLDKDFPNTRFIFEVSKHIESNGALPKSIAS